MTFIPLNKDDTPKEFKAWDKPQELNQAPSKEMIEQQQQENQRQQLFEQAYQEGLAKADEEIQQVKQQLMDLVSLIKKPLLLIDNALEDEILRTVTWFCKHCIGIEVEQSPEKLLVILQQIIPHLPIMDGQRKLYLSHDDISVISQLWQNNENKDLLDDIVEDSSLSRGEFLLSSNSSELDGRFEARLSAILQSNSII